MDLTKLSDAELDALIAKEKGGAPVTAGGAAKAIGSGVAHVGIPGMMGLGGDMGGLMQKYGAWGGEKLRSLFSPAPDPSKMTDAELDAAIAREKQAKAPATPPVEFTDPNGEGPKQLAELKAAHAAGQVPTEPGAGVQFRSSLLPTSEDVKGVVNKVVPEYFGKNKTEDILKAAGGYAPGLVMAPEMTAINSFKTGAKALGTAGARYALAPAAAGEGARELPYIKGSQYEEPVSMAAALMAPSLATKAMTRYPMTDAQMRARDVLKAHDADVGLPGQLTQNPALRMKEARLAQHWGSGTSTELLNEQKNQSFTRGALKHVGLDTDPVLQKLLEAEGGMTSPVRSHIQGTTASMLTAAQPQRGPGGKFLKAQPSAPALAQKEAADVLEKAVNADGVITPKSLATATKDLPHTHPLSRYANAGSRLLPDLKGKESGAFHDTMLTMILAGGAGYGAHEGTKSMLGEYGGYGSGALTGLLTAAARARGYHNPISQALLTKQILPKAMQPGMTKDAAQQLMLAEALAKQGRDVPNH